MKYETEDICGSAREKELCSILGISKLDEVTIIRWQSPDFPPEDARYIFLKYYEPEQKLALLSFAAYEHETYSIPLGNGVWHDIPRECVMGWAYPAFWPVAE